MGELAILLVDLILDFILIFFGSSERKTEVKEKRKARKAKTKI